MTRIDCAQPLQATQTRTVPPQYIAAALLALGMGITVGAVALRKLNGRVGLPLAIGFGGGAITAALWRTEQKETPPPPAPKTVISFKPEASLSPADILAKLEAEPIEVLDLTDWTEAPTEEFLERLSAEGPLQRVIWENPPLDEELLKNFDGTLPEDTTRYLARLTHFNPDWWKPLPRGCEVPFLKLMPRLEGDAVMVLTTFFSRKPASTGDVTPDELLAALPEGLKKTLATLEELPAELHSCERALALLQGAPHLRSLKLDMTEPTDNLYAAIAARPELQIRWCQGITAFLFDDTTSSTFKLAASSATSFPIQQCWKADDFEGQLERMRQAPKLDTFTLCGGAFEWRPQLQAWAEIAKGKIARINSAQKVSQKNLAALLELMEPSRIAFAPDSSATSLFDTTEQEGIFQLLEADYEIQVLNRKEGSLHAPADAGVTDWEVMGWDSLKNNPLQLVRVAQNESENACQLVLLRKG